MDLADLVSVETMKSIENFQRMPYLRKFVYRCYDSEDNLLYVGCTSNPKTRFNWHKSSSEWYEYCSSVQFDIYPCGYMANAAEIGLIKALSPIFNIKDKTGESRGWFSTPEQYIAYVKNGSE